MIHTVYRKLATKANFGVFAMTTLRPTTQSPKKAKLMVETGLIKTERPSHREDVSSTISTTAHLFLYVM